MQTVNYNFVISVIFKTAAAAILDFQIFEFFYGRSPVGSQCASPCQISSKSVTRLQRYGDYTVFKMAAVRHIGFVKFIFLTVGEVKRTILHQHTKYNTKIQYKICKAPCCRGFRGVGEQDS